MAMTEIPAPPPPTPDPQEDSFPAQDVSAPEPEPVPTPEPPAEEEAKPQEPAPAAPEPVADPMKAELEEIRLQLEEQNLKAQLIEKQLQHERMLRDEAASKAGYYKRVATDLAASRRAAPQPRDEFAQEPQEPALPAVSEEAQRFEVELQAIREDAVERAAQDALGMFFAAHPEVKDMSDEMKSFVAEARNTYAPWLDSGDPKLVRKATTMALETAHLKALQARTANRRREQLTARASQLQKLADEKRAAGIPGSGGATPGQQQPKKMTDAEIEEALNNWR